MQTMRIVLSLLALLSLFCFPWAMTAAVAFAAALFLPILGVAAGVALDALYLPAHTLPLAALAGCAGSLIALFVRWFVKARIIGG